MLSTTNDSNENRYSLESGRILNVLSNFLQETLLLAAAIIRMIIFWDVKYFFTVCRNGPENYSMT
jgi:hypothetical protein